MKKLYIVLVLTVLYIGIIPCIYAQVTPFSLPPKWYFGHRGGMDFTGGAPVPMAGNVWDGASYANQEGATTECLPNGNVLYYSNSCVLANGSNTNFGPNPISSTGNSSTQGCISVPNPANPNTSFYFITTDVDASGGSDCATGTRGVWYYGASSVPALGAGTQLIAADQVGEAIAVSSDNAGGYWIVAHHKISGGNDTRYYAWWISPTGAVGAGGAIGNGTVHAAEWRPQASLAFNKCNNRIAYITRNGWEVYNWNSTTGTLGALIRNGVTTGGVAVNGNSYGYGCAFSPDGNILYYTDLTAGLYHVNLSTGTVTMLSNDGAGSFTGYGNLQIGPDDKIYVSNYYGAGDAGPKYLGVVSTPNSTTGAGCGYVRTGAGAFQLAAAGFNYPSSQAGLITLGWHNPNLPILSASSPCTQLSYTYNQYYGTAIPVLAGSEEWDFGSGWVTGLGATPTHDFGGAGSYSVKLRVKDQNCQVFYENSTTITVSCTAPVELLNFKGKLQSEGVVLSWQTAMELNNDFFELQRSVDGKTFETISKIAGAGNSTQLRSYEYIDLTATSKIVYYRLVQHDFDGKTTTSSIVTVYLDKTYSSPIVIMPNPFSSSFTLTKLYAESATVSIYDALGRLLEQKVSGEEELNVTLGESLANGAYVVQYITSTSTYALHVQKR